MACGPTAPAAPIETSESDDFRQLLFRKQDLILTAPTSFGKSLIFGSISVLATKSVTTDIIPLTRVGQQQHERLSHVCSCTPCLLTGNSSSNPGVCKKITDGHFSHILLGPELTVTNKFLKICITPSLKARIIMIAIDEFHLVEPGGETGDMSMHV